jgi:hypothetical protein
LDSCYWIARLPERGRQREARAWFEKLARPSISNADVDAFRIWRDDQDNDAAYSALELSLERTRRFQVRPLSDRYQVVDVWTGQTAVMGTALQADLSEEDARRIAELLNRRAAKGGRSIQK